MPAGCSPTHIKLYKHSEMAIRSFVFAFESSGAVAKDPETFASRMADASKEQGIPTHLHGVFIANRGYFSTCPVSPKIAREEDYYHVRFTETHPLTAFKVSLLGGLATFPRHPAGWAPAIDQYYEGEVAWRTCLPKNNCD